jgi:hypothetical protein
MLDVPEAIYLITEGLRRVDSRKRSAAIEDLNTITKTHYGSNDFFEHIAYTFDDINKDDSSEQDKEYILLAVANASILQRRDSNESILNFRKAGSEYGSIEGLVQAGESYEDM